MKNLPLILGALLLSASNTYAQSNIKIPDQFMMKISPESLDLRNNSNPPRTIEDFDNSCLATIPNGDRFEIKTCDPGDLTQHFRYENNSLINFQNDCLTIETQRLFSNTGLGAEVCNEATQRLNIYDQLINTNVFFRSCNNRESQRFDIELNNSSISFTHNEQCLSTLAVRNGQSGVCFSSGIICPDPSDVSSCFRVDGTEYDFDFDVIQIAATEADRTCTSRDVGEFSLSNPGSGTLLIEKLIPIVIPL